MRRCFALYIPIILFLTGCFGSFSEGERLFKMGDYEKAISEFSGNLFMNVTDIKSLHLRARSYEELGDYSHALEDYRTILRIEPNYAQAFAGIGKIHWKLEDYKNAEKSLLLAAKHDLGDFDILLMLGRAMLINENFGSAIEFLQIAKEINSKDARVYFYQGMARSQTGDILGAAGSFTMCLSYDPDNLIAKYNRGTVLMHLGNPSWALEDFEDVLKSNPDHVEALAKRGMARLLLDNKSGCQDLHKAAAKGSQYAQLHLEKCK